MTGQLNSGDSNASSAKWNRDLKYLRWIVMSVGLVSLMHFVDDWRDSRGMVSRTVESFITAESNWFVGESKTCSSVPLSTASGGQEAGYALSSLECDHGPAHQVKITFWGRERQPEYLLVLWKCTRTASGFECFEISGLHQPDTKRQSLDEIFGNQK